MPRAAARFTLTDISRAVRAADAGRTPRVVEIATDGTIRLVPAIPAVHSPVQENADSDRVEPVGEPVL